MSPPAARRVAGATPYVLLLNVALLLVNVFFVALRRPTGAASGAAPSSSLVGGRVADGRDPFYDALMKEKVVFQAQVEQLREQLRVTAADSDIAERRSATAIKSLRQCQQELSSAKIIGGTLQDEVAKLHHRESELQAALQPTVAATAAPEPSVSQPKADDGGSCKWRGPGSAEAAFLIVGVPTVPRRGEDAATPLVETLLYRTLASMEVQMTGAFGHGVKVLVLNNRPGHHVTFERVREHFKASTWAEFRDNVKPHADTNVPWAAEFAGSNKEQPTDAVRRQTLDVASLLDAAAARSRYYFFAEDDFAFCDNTLMALRYMIQRADEYQGPGAWSAIRCSFGLNGIVMHNSALPSQPPATQAAGGDVAAFRTYLLRHFNRRPPDHLVVEWYAKESREAVAYFGHARRVMAFRYNVAQHLGGHKSTLRVEEAWSLPGCFTELIAPQVFVVEAWNPVDCPHDDIWPCDFNRGRVRPTMIVWNNASEAHVSNSRIVYVGSDGDATQPQQQPKKHPDRAKRVRDRG